jgi:hypothetical protein
MYSDGSKSNGGHTGAGLAIFKMEREGLMSHVVQGHGCICMPASY